MASKNDGEALRYRKLKRAILVGVIVSIVILLAHLYNNFMRRNVVCETAFEREMHELVEHLFAKEEKQNISFYKLNYQGQTSTHDKNDYASEPLLELNEEVGSINGTNSTIELMRRLFDNYNLQTHHDEHVTAEEEQEEYDFLNAVMDTAIMRHALKYLAKKGLISAKRNLQFKQLHSIWFQQYTDIPGRVGSCSGFEHVFLADLYKYNVVGLHSWLYFYEQEKLGKLNYKGYIEKINFGKHDQHLLAVRFSFHNITMLYNTLFVGTSPEFEFSLYTICFLMSMNQPCPIKIGKTKFLIVTHAWKWHGKNIMGLAYPIFDNEYRPFPLRKTHKENPCQSSMKCLKCRKDVNNVKNKKCYN